MQERIIGRHNELQLLAKYMQTVGNHSVVELSADVNYHVPTCESAALNRVFSRL